METTVLMIRHAESPLLFEIDGQVAYLKRMRKMRAK